MKTSLDFHLTQKRFVFPIILSYCASSLCRPQIKMLILEVLHSAVSIRSVALVLCRTQSLLTWLQSFISNHIPEKHKNETVSCIVQILQTLWHTSKAPKRSKQKDKLKPKPAVEPKVDNDNIEDDEKSEEDEEDSEDDSEDSDIDMSVSANTEVNESSETTSAASRQSFHPFYSSFLNEYLLVSLSLLDVIRDHQEMNTLCQYLKFSYPCFTSFPERTPFLIYLTEDYLDFLLRCANATITTDPNEKGIKISTHTMLRTCRQHAIQIMMLVPPKVYVNSDRLTSVFHILTSSLETAVTDFVFVKSFCAWLLASLECCTDKEELLKFLVQPGDDAEKCMTILLACITECISEVSGPTPSASAMDCLRSLVRLFLKLIGKKHGDLAEPCSKISKSLDGLPESLPTDKKTIKLATACHKTLMKDRVSKKIYQRLLSFSTL